MNRFFPVPHRLSQQYAPFSFNFETMNSPNAAGLPYPGTSTDLCPVTSFIKDMITKCREGKKDKNLVINNKLADAKADIACINAKAPVALSYDMLVAAEKSLPDVSFRYVSVYKDEKLVLFVYFQLFTLTARNFNLSKQTSFVKHIISLFLDLKKARVLVMGNALRTETQSFCYDSDILSGQEALDAVAAVAERIGISDDVTAIILPCMEGGHQQGSEALSEIGYSMPWEDQVMEMQVNPAWLSLNDYIAALTRKYKARAVKVREALGDLELKQLSVAEVAACSADISRLFTSVIENQPFVFTTSGADYIVALKQLYKDDFEVTAFLKDGKPVAFYSAFVTANAYELFYVGFDTTLNADYQLYFNLMLEGLERAILLQKPLLKLGRTSFDAKASLGAKPRKTDYLVKLRKVPDVAAKWFTSYFSTLEDAKWKQRNPLKA